MTKLFVIIDGLADLPCPEFKGKTPLEAAKTPNLDFLAKHGKTGYHFPINSKIAPESDIAITALLGYDPYKYYTGRGPLEAYGARMKFKPGDLILRTNFGTIIDKKLIDRRAGRTLTTEEAKELEKAINEKIKLQYPFEFRSTIEHRGVLIIKGDFSDAISNVDPAYIKEGSFGVATSKPSTIMKKCKALNKSKKAKDAAEAINDFTKQSYKILSNHPLNKKRNKKLTLPANIILTRDAGIRLPDFINKKKGWAACVGMPLEKGLARATGMTVLNINYPKLHPKNLFKYLFKSLKCEIKQSKKHIKRKDFDTYYIHFKPTDICGHEGRPFDKKKMIEIIDKSFFKFVRKIKNIQVVVTGDHSTPCHKKAHSADPVPILWYNQKDKDSVELFGETTCKAGSLGKLSGKDVIKLVHFNNG